MKKRLTDTEIWDKPWFRQLSPTDKCAIMFIKDKCDNVGVWIPDKELAEIYIGGQVGWEDLPDRVNGNIVILDNGKWWLPDFVEFQWGELSEETENNARLSYVRLLKKHGLWTEYLNRLRGLSVVSKTTNNKSNNKSKIIKEDAQIIVEYLNKVTGRQFRKIDKNILARFKEGFTKEDMIIVINDRWRRWCGGDMEEYVRPSTLFRPSHFTEYLAEARKNTKQKERKCPECGSAQYVQLTEGMVFYSCGYTEKNKSPPQ